MDIQRPPKKTNVAIIASPDGTPIEHKSGKRLTTPQADIVGGQDDPVVVKEEPIVAKDEPVVINSDIECKFCKSKDLIITPTSVLCNSCFESETV